MKKQYMKPDMQVVKIELCNMIANSKGITSVKGADINDGGGTQSAGITSGNARERCLSDFNLSNDLW